MQGCVCAVSNCSSSPQIVRKRNVVRHLILFWSQGDSLAKGSAWRYLALLGGPMARTSRDPDVIHTAQIENSLVGREVNVRLRVPTIFTHRKNCCSIKGCFSVFKCYSLDNSSKYFRFLDS